MARRRKPVEGVRRIAETWLTKDNLGDFAKEVKDWFRVEIEASGARSRSATTTATSSRATTATEPRAGLLGCDEVGGNPSERGGGD